MGHNSSGNGAVIMINGDGGNGLFKRIVQIIGETKNWPGY
jgi:hypothetical protein